MDDDEIRPFWCGTRQYTEGNCAIGYYIPIENKDTGKPEILFRPIANGLDARYAQELSSGMPVILAEQDGNINQLELYIDTIRIVLDEEHEDIQPRQIQRDVESPSLDL